MSDTIRIDSYLNFKSEFRLRVECAYRSMTLTREEAEELRDKLSVELTREMESESV